MTFGGTLHGWAGLAFGSGTGMLTETGMLLGFPVGTANTITIKLLDILVFGGTFAIEAALDKANGQKGWFEGGGIVVFDPTGGNPTNGTATRLIIIGSGVIVMN